VPQVICWTRQPTVEPGDRTHLAAGSVTSWYVAGTAVPTRRSVNRLPVSPVPDRAHGRCSTTAPSAVDAPATRRQRLLCFVASWYVDTDSWSGYSRWLPDAAEHEAWTTNAPDAVDDAAMSRHSRVPTLRTA
jgi:hypothetical protein